MGTHGHSTGKSLFCPVGQHVTCMSIATCGSMKTNSETNSLVKIAIARKIRRLPRFR